MKGCENCDEALKLCAKCDEPYCPACEGSCASCILPSEMKAEQEQLLRAVFYSYPAEDWARLRINQVINGLRLNSGQFEGESNETVIARVAKHLS